jgi:N-acetylmuramoyl-L-alanine amidase
MQTVILRLVVVATLVLCLLPTSHSDVVVIDPGHGGIDPGAPAINDSDTLCWEKDINLEVAWALVDTLYIMGGFVYHFTRFSDSGLENRWRAYFADTIGADVFVSIHHNSTVQENHETQGTEVYHCCDSTTSGSFNPPFGGVPRDRWEGFMLKKKVYYKLLDAFEYTSRCIVNIPLGLCEFETCENDFTVLKNTVMPSCLTEASFISNWDEAELSCDYFVGEHEQEEAGAIWHGLSSYFWGQGFGRIDYRYVNDSLNPNPCTVWVDNNPYAVPYERCWGLGEQHELDVAYFEFDGCSYTFHHWAELDYTTGQVYNEWPRYMNQIIVAPSVVHDGYHYYEAYFTGGPYSIEFEGLVDNVMIGDNLPIEWACTPGVRNSSGVVIELSRNGGGSWTRLDSVAYDHDDGSYTWVATGPKSPDCFIRLTAIDSVENWDDACGCTPYQRKPAPPSVSNGLGTDPFYREKTRKALDIPDIKSSLR